MSDKTDPRVVQLKQMLYVDDDSDDQLLSLYLQSADAFVKGAITDDSSFYDDTRVKPLYDEAVLSLAGTYYRERLALSETNNYPVDLTVNSIIAQLRGTYNEFQDEQDNKN